MLLSIDELALWSLNLEHMLGKMASKSCMVDLNEPSGISMSKMEA